MASNDQQQTIRKIMFILSLEYYEINRQRTIWQWERDQAFFQEMYRNENTQVLWKGYFCISKGTFAVLCNLLRPRLEKQQTNLRLPVPIEKRIAI